MLKYIYINVLILQYKNVNYFLRSALKKTKTKMREMSSRYESY